MQAYKLASVSWILAKDTRLLGQRQRTVLFIATAIARLPAFAQIPQASIPTGHYEPGQVTPIPRLGYFRGEEPQA